MQALAQYSPMVKVYFCLAVLSAAMSVYQSCELVRRFRARESYRPSGMTVFWLASTPGFLALMWVYVSEQRMGAVR